MSDLAPAAELRAAAVHLREMATEDELYTAIGGSDFGPMRPDLARLLAAVFDQWGRLADLDPGLLHRIGGRETLAVARAVNTPTEET